MEDVYGALSGFIGLVAFAISWLYCISTYGFLFGLGLGWLPSIFVGMFVAIAWPFILVGLVILYYHFN